MVSPRVNTYWMAIVSGSVINDQPSGNPQATMKATSRGRASRKFTSVAVTDTAGRMWGGNGTRLMRLPLSTIELAPDSMADENQIQGKRPAKRKIGYARISIRR